MNHNLSKRESRYDGKGYKEKILKRAKGVKNENAAFTEYLSGSDNAVYDRIRW